ncbi:TPA: glycosyltransferase family 2 protein [Streptococcus suis]|uniref:Cell wall biosynthesis glycosyltransferase n=1 Tax=Streptococcus suis TaxID=1307 RepID=A0A0Z8FG39_STRSU|nr:glycosyltransferase family 2 protein [Streptococcus suis]MBL6439040.1 glycosyltransferase family 2 protein [Streptococcus suis]MBM7137750.1 glycosyltransferase family 2 protein [Streptococcus suis]MBY4600533.1 glycosyltransferase family 2 protein [Streptococcus suis]MCO8172700.1 glycosyltransferase family 2 protein [Streptococcus suis]MCO8181074.1 glycosyltransferase family 2 protein [Streptococcus suis]
MDITIIIPMKDTEDQIMKCLDSIKINTLSRDRYEVIIIDDASKQPSEFLSEKYDIHYFYSKKSLGAGGARNLGIRMARGKYICFIDSDDWISYDYLEKGLTYMEQCASEIGMFTLKREYDDIKDIIYKCKYNTLLQLGPEESIKVMAKEYNFDVNIVPSTTNKIYLRQFLIDNNIFFPENRKFEDLLFSIKTMLAASKLICIPDATYFHYRRKGSIVQSFEHKNSEDMLFILKEIKVYLENNNYFEIYKKSFYLFCEHFMNLIIRQINEFCSDENIKKAEMTFIVKNLLQQINLDEYLASISAEKLRMHIQPYIIDTNIL